MEAVGAVFGIVDVALRTSSKLWKLSGNWRDAPADLHRLRDDLVRTERFFGETQQGIEALYAMSRGHRSESHSSWSEVERLLDAGTAVLRRIEDFVDSLDKGSGYSNTPQPLSKMRKIIWMTSSRKTAALREELRGIISNICNLLIAHNLSMSAETYRSLKESQNSFAVHTERRISESHDITITRLSKALEISQNAILSHIDHRLRITENNLSEKYRGETKIQPLQLQTSKQVPGNKIRCRCRCHIPSKASWRITALRSIIGSVVVTYRGQSTRNCARGACHGHPKGSVSQEMQVLYHLPGWLARASLAASMSNTSMTGGPQLLFSLRVYNRLMGTNRSRGGLFGAVERGDADRVRELLESRTPSFYDLQGEYGQSPLNLAVCNRETEIVKLLLQAGADQYLETANGGGINTSPIGIAFRYSLTGFPKDAEVASLFKVDEFIEEADFRPLHLAIMGELHLDLKRALQQPQYIADIEHRTLNGLTPLDLAVLKDDVDAVRWLIRAGVDVNARDEATTKCPPLERACLHGRYEIAELLLKAGASVTDQDYGGWTALVGAAGACWRTPSAPYSIASRLVTLLLQYGADPATRTRDGLTAFNMAIGCMNIDAAAVLLANGSDIDTVDNDGHPPLHWTIAEGNVEGLKFLLDHGCDLHVANKDGERLIHKLGRYGTPETIHLFTRTETRRRLRGFSLSEKNTHGMTPLDLFNEQRRDAGVTAELEEAFDELLACLEEMQGRQSDTDWSDDGSDDEFVDAQESLATGLLPDTSAGAVHANSTNHLASVEKEKAWIKG